MTTDALDALAARGPAVAIVAHPDDETFGLGAVLARLARTTEVRVVSFTHGEASTLGASEDLAEARADELACAAATLGIDRVEIHAFPDGGLADVDADELDRVVTDAAAGAATLVVLEPSGVTGHPDHRAATAAATRFARAHHLGLLEWGIGPAVAATLNEELGTAFVAFEGDGVVDLDVERGDQLAAIPCHRSQAYDNPVLLRRLELQGPTERVRIRFVEREGGR